MPPLLRVNAHDVVSLIVAARAEGGDSKIRKVSTEIASSDPTAMDVEPIAETNRLNRWF